MTGSDNIIDFAAARAEREPHWAGKAVCLGCRHEWVGVGPVGMVTDLTCPKCDLPKGVTKHLFAKNEGDEVFRCNCGSEAMIHIMRDGALMVMCMGCGTDHSDAV
jgi:hypothetical protein